MAQGSREVIASTVFVPAAIVIVSAYMRNVFGAVAAAVPDSIAVGHYRVFAPLALDPLRTSITARGGTAIGESRIVSVVLLVVGNQTQIDIFVRDDAGALLDDSAFVEVTLARLPL